ncbi:hypothetical protein DFH08DRAFT_802103 [Mycena albidolilacea]|uniref:Glycoside hydrolase family 29 N-terminal domain-containing protein n=1 Tax=Mycena albidolilacea TaxID=1033008 RepID=A0AAD7AGM4_9AGAR|nr:hypothetical protein DFH08DRAFT_802103 [Mycena albidolilacea]
MTRRHRNSVLGRSLFVQTQYTIAASTAYLCCEDFIANFTASAFDAGKWKHHNGFSLFNTGNTTQRSGVHFGPKRDLVAELLNTAKKAGTRPHGLSTAERQRQHAAGTHDVMRAATEQDIRLCLITPASRAHIPQRSVLCNGGDKNCLQRNT